MDQPGASGGSPECVVSAIAPLSAHAAVSSYGGEMPPEVMDADSLARALLDREWREAPVTDAISPCTPVSFEESLEISVPKALPRILVGIRRAPDVSAPDLDVIVSSDAELQMLADACTREPRAAVTLAQLLRTTERLDVESALVAESLGVLHAPAWRRVRGLAEDTAGSTGARIRDARVGRR